MDDDGGGVVLCVDGRGGTTKTAALRTEECVVRYELLRRLRQQTQTRITL
jgi:hypothetical protein